MAIGVFDSGVGGLTVHRRLVDRFPTADFIYYRGPYNVPHETYVAPTLAGVARAVRDLL